MLYMFKTFVSLLSGYGSYIYTYVCTYVHIYTHTFIYIHIHTYIRTYIHVHSNTLTHVPTTEDNIGLTPSDQYDQINN